MVKSALHWFAVRGNLYIKGVPQLLIILAFIAPCVYFTGKYIEAVMQILALLCLRYKFNKTYHAKNVLTCTFITLSIAYLAIPSTAYLSFNLFSGIAVSFAISLISWASQEFIDRGAKISRLELATATPTKQPFNIDTCSKSQLIDRCRERKIKLSRIDYVCDLLLSDLTSDQLAEKYVVEYQTILQDRWRYRKRLK